MQALILAGGLATRMLPATSTTPKILLDVCGRSFASWQLEALRHAGFDDIVMLVGHLGDQVRNALGDGREHGVRLHYADDGETLLGTGGAIVRARGLGLLDDAFLVVYGDSYLPFDHAGPMRALAKHDEFDGMMAVFRNQGRWDASNVELSPDATRVARYEKGANDSALDHIDYGASAFRLRAFDGHENGDRFGLDVVQHELAARGVLGAHVATERFYEIGSPAGLAELRAHLSSKIAAGAREA